MKKITKKQADAFSQVVKSIERLHKTGMVLFGKQFDLVAMTKDTAIYESDNDLLSRDGRGRNGLEYLSASVLWDSGADDYTHYKSNDDDPYKGEYQETPSTYRYNKSHN
jgi:hypothetical protein